jgi:tetratricopeptide (TPR) repeat protein
LAWVHFLQGRFEQALEACEQSLARARDAGALSELAAAENLLGGIYWRQGDLASALHHTRRAMVLREQMGYTWGVASILGNLGILTYQAGTWNKAKSFFERSLTLRQEVGDIEGMVIIHNSLGIVARDQGEYDVAEGHFRQSLAIAEPFQMGYHVGNLRIGLSQTLLLKGEIPLAEETIQTAMDQVEAIGADDLRAEVHCVQAEVLLAQSEFDQAYAVAERAAAVVADIGNRALEASIWRVISTIELERGNVGAARRAIERAQDTLPEATDELEAGRIAAQAGRVDLSESRTAEGEAHLRVAHEVFMRLGAGPDLKRVERIRRRRTAQGAATDVPAPDPSAARFSKG